jgi:hypothetical protein
MKLLLTILACLVAASAGAQTVKSLSYNTTNGQVVYSGTNRLTFTNSLLVASQTGSVLSVGTTNVQIRRDPGSGSLIFTANGNTNTFEFLPSGTLRLSGPLSFDATTNALGYAASTRTNLGATTVGDALFTAASTNAARIALGATIVGANIFTVPIQYQELYLRINADNTVSSLSPAAVRTNLGLGATNNVTFSNITASGTLAVTGNVTLNGSDNLMPGATNAASASSLMTRDLVGQEFANPRTKMQTTYWFSMEGLGLWQLVNSGATSAANRGTKFGPSLAFYTGTRSSANAAGLGLRLGGIAISGGLMWRPIDGGAFTARTHVVNYFAATSTGNRAFGFSFAAGASTNFWGQSNSFGLFWVEQPTNTWAASTAFTANDRIAVSNVVWAVATAGTTDATAPTWTDLINSTVTNGTAVFRNLGPHTSNNWVLAIGSTNASQVVMTNTGKSNWLRASGGSGHDVLLTLRYGTNTAAPYTVYGSVADGTGQGAEVTLNLPTNNVSVSPQYWLRYDSTNSAGANDVAGIRYFSIDAELPPLD